LLKNKVVKNNLRVKDTY